jgi:hypothetical protein
MAERLDAIIAEEVKKYAIWIRPRCAEVMDEIIILAKKRNVPDKLLQSNTVRIGEVARASTNPYQTLLSLRDAHARMRTDRAQSIISYLHLAYCARLAGMEKNINPNELPSRSRAPGYLTTNRG